MPNEEEILAAYSTPGLRRNNLESPTNDRNNSPEPGPAIGNTDHEAIDANCICPVCGNGHRKPQPSDAVDVQTPAPVDPLTGSQRSGKDFINSYIPQSGD